MTKLTWIILALPVLLIGGCNSGGSSSSSVAKEGYYRQIFKPTIRSSDLIQRAESEDPVKPEFQSNLGDSNPNDRYVEVTITPEFFSYYDQKKNDAREGYGIEAIGVLVESTPTVNKYVFLEGSIVYSRGPLATFPLGTYTYTGDIEYYDPDNDPNLTEKKDGTFTITRTFEDPDGKNSISLDWGDDSADVTADLVPVGDNRVEQLHDFTFQKPESGLKGRGSFHDEFSGVYGLFKSTNRAGGFKGGCNASCPVPTQ